MKPARKNILIMAGIIILIIATIASWPKSQGQDQGQDRHKVIYYCPMHPTYTSLKPGACPICQMKFEEIAVTPAPREDLSRPLTGPEEIDKKERKILYWTDTMIPGYKASGPGKSPMGMDLTPVYEDSGAPAAPASVPGHATVSLTAPRQQLIGVKTAKASVRSLTKTIRAVGAVAHDAELYQAQAEYLQANTAFQKAQASGFQEIIEQSQGVVAAIRLRLIHLGFHDGLIEELKQKGQPDENLLLVETGPVWIYAQIYQYELPYVDVGTPVVVTVPSFLQETFEGVVRAVDPIVDAMTRTIRIRIQIKDAKAVLKPGMYVNAHITIDIGQALAVPQDAVFHTGDQDIVFVDLGSGIFQPRLVTLGVEVDDFFEIKSGLKADEAVVTSGNFLLDSESRLKAAIEGTHE